MTESKPSTFSGYEKFIIAILATLQFTIVLDFMVLSPLGYILLDKLDITTSQFGLVVSAYAFSAGAAGLLTAGFADKFDRKKMLLFFYTGFIIGTFLCGIAPTYHFLLMARVFTGLFGGVIGSISFAIITDLFPINARGRVMGFVQMAFASSQVLGIPIGLYLAKEFSWHAPFLMIVGLSLVVGFLIVTYMKPINAHLKIQTQSNAFQHLGKTLSRPEYLQGFAATTLLATGGFMLMPFGTAYGVNNLGIQEAQLPTLYMITGLCMLVFSPFIGKLSDKIGKYKVFLAGSAITCVMTLIYCNLSVTPLWIIIILNVLLFLGITGRMISASALMTAVPEPQDRGAFMGINSSIQQIAGGLASLLAGFIVSETSTGFIEHYPTLGNVVVVAVVVTALLMYRIHRYVTAKVLASSAHDVVKPSV
ncbi:MFS transporter [Dyadobacter chenhuakuii]|uniref:MFS transporter n=1 Tax=Dyadobacter chenhuakuii TaxID=2909339 RepID=A0ABY4XQ22_9BACT|nr:MFS transporter [Dyadobacter chenhuakuii]MCF2493213.1 MFS transporter [Dyadobacter chenhuakuii]USJ32503.1 MFS transporter [Dyadobacter chenhuakuii]